MRKINNAKHLKIKLLNPTLNFGGQNAELCTKGGELGFLQMIL
jgi:23S rRNA A1618 N6-methylase RlmF